MQLPETTVYIKIILKLQEVNNIPTVEFWVVLKCRLGEDLLVVVI